MNIQTAIDRADEMKPNMLSRELKIAALSELDGLIHREIICPPGAGEARNGSPTTRAERSQGWQPGRPQGRRKKC